MMQCTTQLPSGWRLLYTVAFVIASDVIVGVFGGVVFALLRRGRRGLIFPVAALLALTPFNALPAVANLLGVPASAPQAQLGLFFGATVFLMGVFRSVEAALSGTPKGALVSASEFVLYFTGAVDPVYDGKDGGPKPPPCGALRGALLEIVLQLFPIGMLLSIHQNTGGAPTSSMLVADSTRILRLAATMVDNTLGATIIWLFLAACYSIGGILLIAQNRQPIRTFDNPILASTSPRDFWGRRWNLQVHATLKRAVFIPMAQAQAPKSVAGLVAFVASALLHEYQCALALAGYTVGRISSFFLIQAVLCYGQLALERVVPPQAVASVPRPLKTALTLLVMMPFSSIFTDIWRESGMFDSIASLTITLQC